MSDAHIGNDRLKPAWGLGIDAGGTRTRWALADAAGVLVVEGAVQGMSGLQLQTPTGLTHLCTVLQNLASAVTMHTGSEPLSLCAGFTGLGSNDSEMAMQKMLADVLPLVPGCVILTSDIDIAYRAACEPGRGYLVYAGTGSIACYVDAVGQIHRIGGRGGILGDEGGGYWIAREALAQVWRSEDRQPGAWRNSAMARRIFAAVGGDDWAFSRHFMYTRQRGEIGQLALQVAQSAADDNAARQILLRAGAELAQLAGHLLHRFGPLPLVVAGRTLCLSPLIEQSLRAGLPASLNLRVAPDLMAHHTAARLAVNSQPLAHA